MITGEGRGRTSPAWTIWLVALAGLCIGLVAYRDTLHAAAVQWLLQPRMPASAAAQIGAILAGMGLAAALLCGLAKKVRLPSTAAVKPQPDPDGRASTASAQNLESGDREPTAGTSAPALVSLSTALACYRTLFLELIFILVIGRAAVFAGTALADRERVVVAPFTIPDALKKQGFSEDLASEQFGRSLEAIAKLSKTRHSTPRPTDPIGNQMPDVELPGGKFSLSAILTYFGYAPTRVQGHLTLDERKLFLSVTIIRRDGNTTSVSGGPLVLSSKYLAEPASSPVGRGLHHPGQGAGGKAPGPRPGAAVGYPTPEALGEEMRSAAERAMEYLSPYVAADYYYQSERWDKSVSLIRSLLISGDSAEQSWAYTLWGLIVADRSEGKSVPPRAEALFKRAMQLNRGFAEPHYDLGYLKLNASGYTLRVRKASPPRPINEYLVAKREFLAAAALDPRDPEVHQYLGIIYSVSPNQHEQILSTAEYRTALLLDPAHEAEIYEEWGAAQVVAATRTRDRTTRIRLGIQARSTLEESIRRDPLRPKAHFWLGYVDDRFLQDSSSATREYDSALGGWGLEPYVGLAEIQIRRRQYDSAIKALLAGVSACRIVDESTKHALKLVADFRRAAGVRLASRGRLRAARKAYFSHAAQRTANQLLSLFQSEVYA